MDIKRHIFYSLPFGGAIFLATGDPIASGLCSMSSVLIDADHVLDYAVQKRGIGSYADMSECFLSNDKLEKFYVVLHSWEFIIVSMIYFFQVRLIFPILLGFAFHLACDQYYNVSHLGRLRVKPFFYFIFFRVWHRCSVVRLRQML